MSRGRADKAVLLGGDATNEVQRVYKGAETLIAIGTQAGKVLIFNILGLLVHEIEVKAPVISVEWVGDLSAPSILPNRNPSTLLEPCLAINSSADDIESVLHEDSCTVRKSSIPYEQAKGRSSILVDHKRDLFAIDALPRVCPVHAQESLNILSDLPIQAQKEVVRSRKKSLIRPRIATETFKSPAGTALQVCRLPREVIPPSTSKSSTEDVCSGKKVHAVTKLPPALREHQNSTSSVSSHHSEDPGFSNEEFFTPPTTRRDKSKPTERVVSPRVSNSADKKPICLSPPLRSISPMPLDTPSSLYSLPRPGIFNNVFEKSQNEDSGPSIPAHTTKALSKSDMAKTLDTSSPLDSPSSLYSRSMSLFVRNAFLEGREERSPSGRRAPSTPANPYCRPVIGDERKRPVPSSSSSIYSDLRSEMFHNPPPVLDGGVDSATFKLTSLEQSNLAERSQEDPKGGSNLHGLRTAYEQRYNGAGADSVALGADEMRELRQDNEALRRRIEALAEEFRALKGVLLSLTSKE